MVDHEELNKISEDLKNQIIKDHMRTYYHWTVGLLSFLIGLFLGIAI